MTNVNRSVAPERILADIRGMIPDSRQSTCDKGQFQVNRYQFRVDGRSLNEFRAKIAREWILFIPRPFLPILVDIDHRNIV